MIAQGNYQGLKNLKKGSVYIIIDTRIANNGRLDLRVDSLGFWDYSRFVPSVDNFAENLLSKLTAEHLQEEKIRKEIERQPLKKLIFEITKPKY